MSGRRFRLPENSFAFLLLMVLLLSIVWSVESARWVSRIPAFPWLALASLCIGLLLAKSRVHWAAAHLLVLLVGLVVSGWLSASLIERGMLDEKIVQLVLRINAWGYAARTGGINNDTLPFVAIVLFVTWQLGYYAAWSVFRTRRVWGAVIPGGVAMLLNLSYASNSISWYLLFYLFAALLLIVHVYYSLTRQSWRDKGLTYSDKLGFSFFKYAAIIGVVIIIVAWITPTAEAIPGAGEAFDRISDPWRSIQGDFNRLFASIAARDKTFSNDFGNALALRMTTSLSDDTALKVVSEEAHYWRAITYDSYTGQGWVSSHKDKEYITARSDTGYNEQYWRRKVVQQTVVLESPKNDLFFAAGNPTWFDFPANIEHDPGAQIGEVTAARGAISLRRGQAYSVKSSISVASLQELKEAGTDYPEWVKERYLQIPRTVPRRVRALAEQLANQPSNPYDKAVAIEDYLRKLDYDRNVGEIPYGRDLVDFFVFSSRKGYCDYFSTSMAVMLRSVGIPARVVAGYMTGTFSDSENAYIVKESDAHSWTEAYFPGYGWIEFEPTSGNPRFSRLLVPHLEVFETAGDSDSSSFSPAEIEEATSLFDALPSTSEFTIPWPLFYFVLPAGLIILIAWDTWGSGSGKLIAEIHFYERFCRLSRITRIGPKKHETPMEFAGRVGKALPEGAGSIELIARSYTDARYGKKVLGEKERENVRRAWISLSYKMVSRFWVRIPRLRRPPTVKKEERS